MPRISEGIRQRTLMYVKSKLLLKVQKKNEQSDKNKNRKKLKKINKATATAVGREPLTFRPEIGIK